MPFTDQLTGRERTIGYNQTVTISARVAVTASSNLIFTTGPSTQVVPVDAIICPKLSVSISARRDYADHSEYDYGIVVAGDGSTSGGSKILGTKSVPLSAVWTAIDVMATLNVHAEETCVEYLDTTTPYREVNKPGTIRGILITCGGTVLFDNRQTIPAGSYSNTPVYYAPYFNDIAAESRNYELLDNTGNNPVWLSTGATFSASVSRFGQGYCDAPDVGTFSSEAGVSSLFYAKSNVPPQWTHAETINRTGPVFGASFKDTGGSPSSVVTITGRVRNADQPSTTPHDLRLTVGDSSVLSLPVNVMGEASLTATVGGWGMAFATYRNSTTQSGKQSQWDNGGTELPVIRAKNAAVRLEPDDPVRQFLRYLEQKDSVTVQQAASCPLFPAWNVTPSTPNRWVNQFSSAVTLSVVSSPGGTALRLQTTTSSSASAAGAFSTTERFAPPLRQGYRWYKIRFRSVGSANVPITIAGWSLTTGADGVWVEAEKDIFDSFPSRSVTAGYGVPDSTISLPGNRTIEVESVIGIRKKESLFSITGATTPVIGGNIHAFTDGWLSYVLPNNTASIKAFVDHINLSTPSSGWSATNLRPAVAGDTDIWGDGQPPALLESGGTDNTSKVYLDLPTPVTLRARHSVRAGATLYPGCGDIFGIGSHGYGFITQLTLDLHTGAFVTGTLRGNTSATVTAKIEATGADRGSGAGNDQGFANIGYPYLYTSQANKSPSDPTPIHKIDTSVSGSVPWQTPNLLPVSGQSFYRITPGVLARYWTVWDVPPGMSGSPICIDSPRQMLYWGKLKKISAYHLATATLAFESADYAVEYWESLAFDSRKALLFAVAKIAGSDTRKVYRSGNGGKNIVEVLSMTAKSSQIEKDSERGLLVLLFQDSDDTLKRRLSKDSGATWSAAEAIVVDGGGKSGVVQGMAQDSRAVGVLVATIGNVAGTATTVIRSRDCGKNWVTVLS